MGESCSFYPFFLLVFFLCFCVFVFLGFYHLHSYREPSWSGIRTAIVAGLQLRALSDKESMC